MQSVMEECRSHGTGTGTVVCVHARMYVCVMYWMVEFVLLVAL